MIAGGRAGDKRTSVVTRLSGLRYRWPMFPPPASLPPVTPLRLHSVPLLLLAAAALPAQAPTTHRIAREDVLGTSSLLVVVAADEAGATKVEQAVFGEVERLRHVLSAYDDDSELSQLVKAGQAKVSPDLAAALRLAADWRERTHGAFEPGVARLTALWNAAAKDGKEPDGAALQAAVATFAQPPFALADGTATAHGAIALDGVAKGWIVDQAFAAGNRAGGASAHVASFQIGGDLRIAGDTRDVAITDPRHPAANGEPLATLRLANAALASSGGYERGFDVAGKHHSHILDPHTGHPADGVLGASVVAADVASADALATTLCVLPAEDGLKLLAANGAEGVLVTADGEVHASAGWAKLAAPAPETPFAGSQPWREGYALQVAFEIKAPAEEGGRRRGGWKRPYVAVWIEDITGGPVKTLCLWIENPRWLRDLRRWSRQYAEMPQMPDLVSSATRRAGNYTLTWDGTSDDGIHVAPGRYTVCIEATREHGTYQIIRREVELGGDAVRVELPGNEEIAKAELRFGAAKAEQAPR